MGIIPTPSSTNYGAWTAGDPVALARPPEDFVDGGFAPTTPMIPASIDVPPENLPRPQPRRWEYPVAWNMPTPPGTEGIRLAPFQTLRAYADMSTFLRACIDKRIEEILGLEWDITPTIEAEKSMANGVGMADFQARRIKALEFFARPDPEYNTFHSWLRAVLEDVFVIDALSIYIAPPRVPGHGLFGTDVAALTLIDGTTIRPLIDLHGGTPAPPAVAFQQYMWGVPRVDMVDVITQEEMDDEFGPPAAQLRGDQMLYLPYRRRTTSPYGYSHVESCMVPVGIELAKQKYVLSYYSEGNVPATWLTIGNADTPQQVKQWQDALDAMIGDVGARHQVFALPDGSAGQPTHPNAMVDSYDMSNKEEILANFALTAMEMGMLPGGKSGGMSAGSSMAKANQDTGMRTATKPLLMFLKRNLFDLVLQQFAGQKDMQWHWKGLEPPEDVEKILQTDIALVNAGIKSRDETRRERGLQPWSIPLTQEPTVTTPQGVISLATGAMANPNAMDPTGNISSSPDSPGSTPLHQTTPPPQHPGAPQSVTSRPQPQQQTNNKPDDNEDEKPAAKKFAELYGTERLALEEQRARNPRYVEFATKAARVFNGEDEKLPFSLDGAQTPLEVLDLVAAYCDTLSSESTWAN